VVFQSDPFAVCDDANLYCFEEDKSMTLLTCRFNSSWLYYAYGINVLEAIGHNPISCAGVTIGSYKIILQYIEVLCNELLKLPPIPGLDQGVHNFMIRSGLVPNTVIYPNEFGPVYTLGYVKPENIAVDTQGFVINKFGIPCVVHQYDRHQPLLMEIQRRYVV